MKYRRLGKTNLDVSVIGIGTWQLGGEWGKDFTQDEVDAMFARGRELGINLVDTAECYGDHVSERLVGGAIGRERGSGSSRRSLGIGLRGICRGVMKGRLRMCRGSWRIR